MRSRSLSLHGFTLTAHAHGSVNEDAPLVVLVHGMMEPAAVWQPVLEVLTEGVSPYRCITLEMPWNGLQGGLWGRHMAPQAWLQAALEQFDLHPDAWVAHSFGASALLALLSGNRSGRGAEAPAVLISPFYKATHQEVTWPLFQRYVNNFTDFVELSIRVRMEDRVIDPAVLGRMTEAARDAFGCYVWTEFWRLFAAMPFLPLHKVSQPVLLLTGSEDFSSALPDVQALESALPEAALQAYVGASHFLLSSRRDEVTRAVASFLSRVSLVERGWKTLA